MANVTIDPPPVHTIRGQALRDAGLEFCWICLGSERAMPTLNKVWPLSMFLQFDSLRPCANELIPAE